jgi:hypothetical protein
MTSARVHPYATASYAGAVMKDKGVTIEAPEWGGFVLTREIPGAGHHDPIALYDAIGVYPLTPMPRDADLEAGLARLSRLGLVSVVLVPDPLASPDSARLAAAFDLCRSFKTHLLIDPEAGPYDPSKHHRDRIRRGRRRCRVERVRLADHLDSWKTLYAGLVERRAVTGPAAFSAAYFDSLAGEPRIEAFAAFIGEELAAMTLWFEHAGVVYNHLTASNALGYANGATFALYDAAIDRFGEAGVINLGAGAGLSDDPDDGLAAFKRGFANSQIQAHLCGAILNLDRYAALAAGAPATAYFPSYRG